MVFLGLPLGGLMAVEEIGFAMTVALLLDAMVVRACSFRR